MIKPTCARIRSLWLYLMLYVFVKHLTHETIARASASSRQEGEGGTKWRIIV